MALSMRRICKYHLSRGLKVGKKSRSRSLQRVCWYRHSIHAKCNYLWISRKNKIPTNFVTSSSLSKESEVLTKIKRQSSYKKHFQRCMQQREQSLHFHHKQNTLSLITDALTTTRRHKETQRRLSQNDSFLLQKPQNIAREWNSSTCSQIKECKNNDCFIRNSQPRNLKYTALEGLDHHLEFFKAKM